MNKETKFLKNFAELFGEPDQLEVSKFARYTNDVYQITQSEPELTREELADFLNQGEELIIELENTLKIVETLQSEDISRDELLSFLSEDDNSTKTIQSEDISRDELLSFLSENDNPTDLTPVVESGRPEEAQIPINDYVNQTVNALSKSTQKNIQDVANSIPDSIRKEIDILKKSVADIHRFAQRHAQIGGGGEVRLQKLDDVNYASLKDAVDGQVLTYNATTKKWYASSSGIAGITSNGSNTITLESGYNFIPSSNNLQDLGSPTRAFRDLYLSSNSIHLGDTTLTAGEDGEIIVQSNNAVFVLDGQIGQANVGNVVPIAANTGTFWLDTDTCILSLNIGDYSNIVWISV